MEVYMYASYAMAERSLICGHPEVKVTATNTGTHGEDENTVELVMSICTAKALRTELDRAIEDAEKVR